MPRPDAGDGAQAALVGRALVGLELVLAVAEEGEVVVGQPGEEVAALGAPRPPAAAAGRRSSSPTTASTWACILSQSSTDSRTSRSTRCTPSVISAASSSSVRSISTCIHDSAPSSAPLAGVAAVLVRTCDLLQRAGDVALDGELRVDHGVHVVPEPVELHGHRVDEERHVVGDDLDHRAARRRPARVGAGGRDDADGRGALRADDGELAVRGQGAEQVLGERSATSSGATWR